VDPGGRETQPPILVWGSAIFFSVMRAGIAHLPTDEKGLQRSEWEGDPSVEVWRLLGVKPRGLAIQRAALICAYQQRLCAVNELERRYS
jgi:hypothetical protein